VSKFILIYHQNKDIWKFQKINQPSSKGKCKSVVNTLLKIPNQVM
jgi:hypothetical protein